MTSEKPSGTQRGLTRAFAEAFKAFKKKRIDLDDLSAVHTTSLQHTHYTKGQQRFFGAPQEPGI